MLPEYWSAESGGVLRSGVSIIDAVRKKAQLRAPLTISFRKWMTFWQSAFRISEDGMNRCLIYRGKFREIKTQ